jgi:hypothetical protein
MRPACSEPGLNHKHNATGRHASSYMRTSASCYKHVTWTSALRVLHQCAPLPPAGVPSLILGETSNHLWGWPSLVSNEEVSFRWTMRAERGAPSLTNASNFAFVSSDTRPRCSRRGNNFRFHVNQSRVWVTNLSNLNILKIHSSATFTPFHDYVVGRTVRESQSCIHSFGRKDLM